MKPLFTVHAGEYLVGSHIERRFRRVNVWLPTKDTGIDLLASNPSNRHSVSLQVKFSKDFLVTHLGPVFQPALKACGWWSLNHAKLRQSRADYWVFVLHGFARRSVDYIVIPPRDLLKRLQRVHGQQETYQVYLWVTAKKRCWETRGLKKPDKLSIVDGTFVHGARDFTSWLNDWDPIARLNR